MTSPSAASWDHDGGFVHDHRTVALLVTEVQPPGDHLRSQHRLRPDRGECLLEWVDARRRRAAAVLWRADGGDEAWLLGSSGTTLRHFTRPPGREWPTGFVHALRMHLATLELALEEAGEPVLVGSHVESEDRR